MRYRLLALLCLAAIIAYVQRNAMSVPLKQIAEELGREQARDKGWLIFAFYFGYAALQLPSGWFADRIGSRLAIAILCVVWSLLTLASGLAPDYWTLLAFWSLMGAAQAGIFPCATKAIGQAFPPAETARASGILISGMAVGTAVGPLVTTWLLAVLSRSGASTAVDMSDWRLCLMIYCLPGICWSVLFLGLVPTGDLPSVPALPPKLAKPTQRIDWSCMLTSVPLALLCAQQFLRAAAIVFFYALFPTFLQEARGVSQFNSGMLSFCTGASMLAGSLAGGFASDELLRRTGNRRLSRQGIAVAGIASCAALIFLSTYVADTRWAVAVICLGVFCAQFGGVSGYTVAIEFGGKQVATVFSTMNMCGNIGAMLFPVAATWFVDRTGNWNLCLPLFAGIMAASAVCWALLNPRGTLFDGDFPQNGGEPEAHPYERG